ncbi:MAG: bifunctional ornithine acetyltransferase/N-acetylglutamate synthase, partial [Bacilli bacterium]
MTVENSVGVLKVKKPSFTMMESGSVTSPKGFVAGGVHCGIKKKRLDLGWVYSVVPAVAAGVYTTNQFQAAPLIVTKESVAFDHKIQGILVNSGVANACTGDRGLVDAYAMRKMFADKLGMNEQHVAVASTGVIGAHLPMDKIKAGIKDIEVKQFPTET